MHAGPHHQRTIDRDMAFATAQRFFIERRRAEIEMHGLEIAQAVAGQIIHGAICAVGHDRSQNAEWPPIAGHKPGHKCIQFAAHS
jgi:hypothetical protein